MSEVFADAGYWVAMLDARDRLHDRARAVTATLGTRRIVTTHMVLADVLNLMASAGEHRRQRAWELAQGLERDTDVVVVPRLTPSSLPHWSDMRPGATRHGV